MSEPDLLDPNSALGSYSGCMVDKKQIIQIIWGPEQLDMMERLGALTYGMHFEKMERG